MAAVVSDNVDGSVLPLCDGSSTRSLRSRGQQSSDSHDVAGCYRQFEVPIDAADAAVDGLSNVADRLAQPKCSSMRLRTIWLAA